MAPRTKRRGAALAAAALALGGLALQLALSPGCQLVQSTADTLAGATKGTAAGDVFGGVARAAESMRDFDPAEEYFIGRAVAAQILTQMKPIEDEALTRYVNLVGQAVLAAPEAARTTMNYRFVVVEGEELQAVSAPGGFVFLTEGTVRRAKDEDELAAVLAHEVAHVTLRHGIGSIKAATRKQAFMLLAKVGLDQGGNAVGAGAGQDLVELTKVFGTAIQDITTDLLVKGYSRESELDADLLAARILESSRYARTALREYLQQVEAAREGGSGGWLGTHPAPGDRVAALGDAPGGDVPTAVAEGRAVRKARFLEAVPRA